jgi:hypothetical protein
MLHPLSLSEISHVIALAAAPAFLLGGIVSFLALLTSRMASIVDRARFLDGLEAAAEKRASIDGDLVVLRRRATLIHLAMATSILSGVATASLIIVAFAGALLDLELELVIAVLFLLSMLAFMGSLCLMVYEAFVGFDELGRYR